MLDTGKYITDNEIKYIINFIKSDNEWKSNWSNILDISDLYDATYLGKKYGIDIDFTPVKIGKYMYITNTRKEFYIQKMMKQYGASKLNGQNMKHTKGTGSTKKGSDKGKNRKPKEEFDPPPYNIEWLHKFNYNEWISCKEDMKFNKIYRIKFDHVFYNEWQIKMYKAIQDRYYEDLNNGVIDKISVYARKLSAYMHKNKLCIDKHDENMIEGSVICNVALMISKYLKTGIFDTNIDWINKLDIDDLNNFDNIYVLFLLLQSFSCKYHYKKLYINDEFIKDWWAINLIRRRDKNEDTKTLGILPKFDKSQNGDTIYVLY